MKLGILLFNLGGPSSLVEVEPFLVELFSDPDIIPIPFKRWTQKPLAKLIAKSRRKLSQSYYSAIGGGSPLVEITRMQAEALEVGLKRESSLGPEETLAKRVSRDLTNSLPLAMDVKVYVGMRYSRPFIQDAWQEMVRDGRTDVVILPLFPQYSVATTGSGFKVVQGLYNEGNGIRIHYIKDWYSHPLYIEAMTAKINAAIDRLPVQFKNNFHLIFSAHSLPVKILEAGDPYEQQIKETIQLILPKLQRVSSWHLTYQSKVGPMRWLGPSTLNVMRDLAKESPRRALVMVPISFVSDHVETLYEMDVYYQKESVRLGFPYFGRSESLNVDPVFISALENVVRNNLPKFIPPPEVV